MPDHVLPYSWRHPRPPELALGDHATGLSTVHVNRTLQELRGNRLISTPKSGRVVIEDWERLQEAGEFDATYLHLKQAA